MIEENATVVSTTAGRVLIESFRSSACGQCQARHSCGQKAISEWASSKMTQLEIDNPHGLDVGIGDKVVVGIDEGSFLKASALMYLLPLVVMLLLGGLANRWIGTEVSTIIFSFVGLVVGFIGARLLGRQLEKSCQYKPVLLRILLNDTRVVES
ncbi:SoxR reducing system RseC family protein [Neptunomonas japonica]|uniref:Sigma-E factor negative regulatory protein RseC n=1 Tax=Neptunomonas japonica JAMM 1380 TaxID=1441457 RepID=A0A7R6PBZ7_9GAMM|nr:SoxR reducing system RseC family protein [Neptunomonas japonica]BBB30963.1 sigma-E factor negative regulatory protein RseC [Neptunomonas japonica JAMM 1380]